ncbi:MAG: tetratricopeptide repeat protein [Candidatus Kariarchaeaceae archaeon]|jgi:tetratricopeptide (TPR) repeat protein
MNQELLADQIRSERPKQRELLPYIIYKSKNDSKGFLVFWSGFKLILFIWIISLLFTYIIWGITLLVIFFILFNPSSNFLTRNNPFFILEQITQQTVNEKDPQSISNRGIAFLKLGKLDVALRDLNHSIKIDPDNPMVWMYKAIALFNQRDYEQSLKAINRATQLDPEDEYKLSVKFNVLNQLNRLEEAQEIREIIKELSRKTIN